MPAYEYSVDHGAWIKECGECGEVVIGTVDELESLGVFKVRFAQHGTDGGDGFQIYCRGCVSYLSREYAYGKNRAMIRDMWLKQKKRCPMCLPEAPELSLESGAPLSIRACIDHDKVTGKVKQLTCNRHNVGLGHFNHDVRELELALAYQWAHMPKQVVRIGKKKIRWNK